MHRNRKKRLVLFAKFLIALSIALLIYGLILDYGTPGKKLIDPIRDVEPIEEEENTVNVTTATEIETEEEIIISGSRNGNNKIVGNNDSVPTSIDEVNNKLRDEIQKKYDITIAYGSETNGYSVKNGGTVITTNPITNADVVNSQLNQLNQTLDMYPNGMFREIKNGGIPLKIILVDSYSDTSVTGVTDSSYEYANISIAAMYPFAESFYHESYHYIERYMFKNGANFNSWDTLNPSGFRWNTIDGSLSYNNTFSQDAPFVNNYAQTAATEDRASTFEYMMASSKASCLNNGTTVWKKANYMSQMIRQVISSVRNSSNVRWEQYLY